MLLSLPYVAYIALIFVYPLGFAIWMSFHRYFFTAPGVSVPHPFVGLDNYKAVLTDPDVLASFGHVGIFLVINVPLTVVLSLTLAAALNRGIRGQTFFRVSYYVPYVTASVAVVGVWLFMFSTNGLVNNILGPLAPSPSWLISSTWAMPLIAFFVTWKQLGFFILLYLAVPAERPQGTLRIRLDRRGQRIPDLQVRHRSRRPARRPDWSLCWPSSSARTCSPSPTCSPAAAARPAPPPPPCC